MQIFKDKEWQCGLKNDLLCAACKRFTSDERISHTENEGVGKVVSWKYNWKES